MSQQSTTSRRPLYPHAIRKQARLPWTAWVAASCGLFMLTAGVALWHGWEFAVRDHDGIVGWISVNRYPKQQELVAFVGAVAAMVLGVLAGPWGWWWLTRWLARRRRMRPRLVLRCLGLAAAGLLLGLLPLLLGLWSAWWLVGLPLAVAVSLALALLRRPPAWCSNAPWRPDSGYRASTPAAPSPPAAAARSPAIRRLRLAFDWVFMPGLIIWLLRDAGVLPPLLDLFHEGEALAPLNAMRHGELVFRDFYIQHGLALNVGLGWLATLFGAPTVEGMRTAYQLYVPLGAISLYVLGTQLFRSRLTAAVLVLGMIAMAVFPSTRFGLQLLSMGAMAHALRVLSVPSSRAEAVALRQAAGAVLLAGVLSGLAFFWSVESGFYSLAANGLLLALWAVSDPRWRPATRWGISAALPFGLLLAWAPFLLYFAHNGALTGLISTIHAQVAYQLPVWGLPFPSLLALLRGDPGLSPIESLTPAQVLQAYVPPLLYVLTAGVLAFRFARGGFWRSPLAVLALLVLLHGMAQFRSALGRSDIGHILSALTPLLTLLMLVSEGVLFAAYRRLRTGGRRRRATALGILLLLAALAVGIWRLYARPPVTELAQQNAAAPTMPVSTWAPIGGAALEGEHTASLRRMVEAIQRHVPAGAPFYDFTNQPAYYFLAERPSPSRYLMAAYAATPAQQRRVIAELEQARPRLLIYSTENWTGAPDGIPNRERQPLLAAYLERHYAPAEVIDGNSIWLRLDTAAP